MSIHSFGHIVYIVSDRTPYLVPMLSFFRTSSDEEYFYKFSEQSQQLTIKGSNVAKVQPDRMLTSNAIQCSLI